MPFLWKRIAIENKMYNLNSTKFMHIWWNIFRLTEFDDKNVLSFRFINLSLKFT